MSYEAPDHNPSSHSSVSEASAIEETPDQITHRLLQADFSADDGTVVLGAVHHLGHLLDGRKHSPAWLLRLKNEGAIQIGPYHVDERFTADEGQLYCKVTDYLVELLDDLDAADGLL